MSSPAAAFGPFLILPEHAGFTLAALMRLHLPSQSWSQVHRLIETRRVQLNGELCLDPARRLKEGEVVELLPRPEPRLQRLRYDRCRHSQLY